jgi:ribonuclease H2 subunit A
MLRSSPVSLNTLSYDAVVRALKKIITTNAVAPVITTVFVDTVGDPEFYRRKLVEGLGEGFADFVIEKKADAKYKTVSAASIVAKVTRDRVVADWQWRESNVTLDKDFGSGYPGDESCVNWYAS